MRVTLTSWMGEEITPADCRTRVRGPPRASAAPQSGTALAPVTLWALGSRAPRALASALATALLTKSPSTGSALLDCAFRPLACLRFDFAIPLEELATLAVSFAASWLAGALVAATFLLAGGRLPSRAPLLLVRGMFAGSVCE